MLPPEGAETGPTRALIRDHWRAMLVAVRFLTRLPTPHVDLGDEADRQAVLGRATAYFPAVGALIGAGTGATILLAARVWPMVVAVALGLAFEAVVTGAFHEDAVADFCDAFGGGWTREDILRILKDSRVGSFGVLGLGLAVTLRGGSLAALDADWLLPAATASASLGRWSILPAIWALPPVAERQSISRDVGQRIDRGRLALGTALAIPGCLGLAMKSPGRLMLALVAVVAITAWLVVYVRRKLGGITGDCLGFLCYAAQVTVLLVAAGRWPSGVTR
jgi:adenosylcobinamide-GDP ribazoletransferase